MKQKNVMFHEKQEAYKYQNLGNGTAVVFIREYVGEEKQKDENGLETVLFVYNQNEFIVNINEIPEDIIMENPISWINYCPYENNISLENRVEALEMALLEIAEVM